MRRQISKNARWERSPYFGAVDGKQPLGSLGLRQLEKCVEGTRRHSFSALFEKAKLNKLTVTKQNKWSSLRDLGSQIIQLYELILFRLVFHFFRIDFFSNFL